MVLPHDALRGVGEQLYLGGPVDVTLTLVDTEDLAVRIQHVAAYPHGFSFVVALWSDEPAHVMHEAAEALSFNPHRRGRRSAAQLHVLVELPDGTTLVPAHGGQHYTEPRLEQVTAYGEHGFYTAELVAPILPADGPVTFVFEWASRGIAGARATFDAALLAEAATRAQPLFAVADRP